ncbi:MAG: amidase, partial [Bacteroidota bacterium]
MNNTTLRLLLLLTLCGVCFVVGMLVGGRGLDTDMRSAERLAVLEFTTAERDSMQDDLRDFSANYVKTRGVDIPNSLAPALLF